MSTQIHEPRPLNPKVLGLRVLAQPEDEGAIDLDIVAVHGIGADPQDTWVHKNKVNWLKDLLPKNFPNARIMAFGYVSYWFGNQARRQRLDSLSVELLSKLADKRKECEGRPIVLIGHCFGGVVMQQAYVHACRDTDDYPDIAGCIIGMIFLGTPHRGIDGSSSLGTQGQIYKTILAANLRMEVNLLQTMYQDNDVLMKAVDRFTKLINTQQHSPRLYCFYEQDHCAIGKIIGLRNHPKEFVVNYSSGTIPGHGHHGFSLDHFNMNKFEGDYDTNYEAVRIQIQMAMDTWAKQFGRSAQPVWSGNHSAWGGTLVHYQQPQLPTSHQQFSQKAANQHYSDVNAADWQHSPLAG